MERPTLYLLLIILTTIPLSFIVLASDEKPQLPDISEEQFRKHLVRPGTSSPKSRPTVLRVRLRTEPRRLSVKDVENMAVSFRFYISNYNKSGDFQNDFIDNRDGTVTDRVTGLMWQKSGSDKYLNYEKAHAYIRRLNRKGFGGHRDWRLPTLEELASLIERKEVKGLYMDPIFNREQWWCWSADTSSSGSAWVVYFSFGRVYWYYLLYSGNYVRAVRSWQ